MDGLTVTGTAANMGWSGNKKPRFRVVIYLDEPPKWPLQVVWDKWPIRLEPLPPNQGD